MRISDWSSDVCSSDLSTCEGVISIQDMGVEGNAWFVAAARVDVADRGPTAPGMKLLSVARRRGAVSPQRGERHGAMGVDQPSQRFALGGFADRSYKSRVGKEGDCRVGLDGRGIFKKKNN